MLSIIQNYVYLFICLCSVYTEGSSVGKRDVIERNRKET